ncbi:MAG: PH domain-containing protein [Thermofilaceae archaeon]|nr:PH domain-containing protein [Thermofilaceae archaeon]MDW8004326.1 PH domain-containing protein [Thermofilaceae archaeon]
MKEGRQVLWSGKPYMKKTVVKFILVFLFFLLILMPLWFVAPSFFLAYITVIPVLFAFYYYWKSAHTYYLTENSVLITRRWVFGSYHREITLDRIHDVHVQQGILARAFNCGSLVFTTLTGLEVGYSYTEVGRGVRFGAARPKLLRTPLNSFLDVRDPESVKDTVVKRLAAWREVLQQQRMAVSLEKIAEQRVAPSVADELAKLKKLLDEGVITREEYEKLKKRIVEG